MIDRRLARGRIRRSPVALREGRCRRRGDVDGEPPRCADALRKTSWRARGPAPGVRWIAHQGRLDCCAGRAPVARTRTIHASRNPWAQRLEEKDDEDAERRRVSVNSRGAGRRARTIGPVVKRLHPCVWVSSREHVGVARRGAGRDGAWTGRGGGGGARAPAARRALWAREGVG